MKKTIKDEINRLYSLFKTRPKLDVKSTQQHLETFAHRLVSKEVITPLKRAVNQIKSIGKCAWCGASKDKVQNGLRDELSKKEYQISALCQSCQDKVFAERDLQFQSEGDSSHFFPVDSIWNEENQDYEQIWEEEQRNV
jgi:hypothetical protein